MTRSEMYLVNGMRLPKVLIDAIESGRWKSPSMSVFQAAFAHEQLERPELFAMDRMRLENRSWLDDRFCSLFLANEAGDWQPGQGRAPLVVNIGCLATDQPIALDYKSSSADPRVIYLVGASAARWEQISNHLSEFMTLMRL